MGVQRDYNGEGGFSRYLYIQIGKTFTAANGIVAKVVSKIGGTLYEGLPTFSKTSEVYLRLDKYDNIVQARIYKNRKPICDFDWDHSHKNRNGDMFEKGVVHVQEFVQKANGGWERNSKKARYMSNDEVARYGELLKRINPKIKFKP